MDNTSSTSQVSAIPFGSKPLQVLGSGVLRCCGEVELFIQFGGGCGDTMEGD